MNVITLKAERAVRKENIKGIEFLVAISPFFSPTHIEHGYDQESGCYNIEFKYLDEEPGERCSNSDEVVSLIVGRNTGRLLSICIHVDKHNLDSFLMTVTDDIPKALNIAKQRKPDASENYEVAGRFLQEHRFEIANAAATT